MDSSLFSRFRVVLCRPQVAGNVGAICRSMLNFGPRRLHLVTPGCDHLCQEAVRRARDGTPLLRSAALFPDLPSAVAGCVHVIGATARRRAVDRVPMRPGEAIARALEALGPDDQVALVFGHETSGMTNEEVDFCHSVMTIPTCPDLKSLNLSMAASIVLYELHMAVADRAEAGAWPPARRGETKPNPPATAEQLEAMYGQMQDALDAARFLNPQNPKITMRYLRRFFGHSGISEWELRLWRAIWKRFIDVIRTPKPRFWPRKEWEEFQRQRQAQAEKTVEPAELPPGPDSPEPGQPN